MLKIVLLERIILMEKNFKMLAKSFYGMEKILALELKQLGAADVYEGNRLVHFTGDKGFMYKANLCLRTALKILKPIFQFRAENESVLYEKLYNYDWSNLLSPDQTFAIDSVVHGKVFNHSLYVTQRCKDAIVDRFRKDHGRRPTIDTVIRIYDCTFTFLIKNVVYPSTLPVILCTTGGTDP